MNTIMSRKHTLWQHMSVTKEVSAQICRAACLERGAWAPTHCCLLGNVLDDLAPGEYESLDSGGTQLHVGCAMLKRQG